jgi:hypothetical protein
MPCFYCGKRVSLVRQLNDPDFCSDEHRARYHDLTRLALGRLLDTREQAAAAAPRRKPPAVKAAEPVQTHHRTPEPISDSGPAGFQSEPVSLYVRQNIPTVSIPAEAPVAPAAFPEIPPAEAGFQLPAGLAAPSPLTASVDEPKPRLGPAIAKFSARALPPAFPHSGDFAANRKFPAAFFVDVPHEPGAQPTRLRFRGMQSLAHHAIRERFPEITLRPATWTAGPAGAVPAPRPHPAALPRIFSTAAIPFAAAGAVYPEAARRGPFSGAQCAFQRSAPAQAFAPPTPRATLSLVLPIAVPPILPEAEGEADAGTITAALGLKDLRAVEAVRPAPMGPRAECEAFLIAPPVPDLPRPCAPRPLAPPPVAKFVAGGLLPHMCGSHSEPGRTHTLAACAHFAAAPPSINPLTAPRAAYTLNLGETVTWVAEPKTAAGIRTGAAPVVTGNAAASYPTVSITPAVASGPLLCAADSSWTARPAPLLAQLKSAAAVSGEMRPAVPQTTPAVCGGIRIGVQDLLPLAARTGALPGGPATPRLSGPAEMARPQLGLPAFAGAKTVLPGCDLAPFGGVRIADVPAEFRKPLAPLGRSCAMAMPAAVTYGAPRRTIALCGFAFSAAPAARNPIIAPVVQPLELEAAGLACPESRPVELRCGLGATAALPYVIRPVARPIEVRVPGFEAVSLAPALRGGSAIPGALLAARAGLRRLQDPAPVCNVSKPAGFACGIPFISVRLPLAPAAPSARGTLEPAAAFRVATPRALHAGGGLRMEAFAGLQFRAAVPGSAALVCGLLPASLSVIARPAPEPEAAAALPVASPPPLVARRRRAELPRVRPQEQCAHMPCGVFAFLEVGDLDNSSTARMAPGYSEAGPGPRIPAFPFGSECAGSPRPGRFEQVPGAPARGWNAPAAAGPQFAPHVAILPWAGTSPVEFDFYAAAAAARERGWGLVTSVFRVVLFAFALPPAGNQPPGAEPPTMRFEAINTHAVVRVNDQAAAQWKSLARLIHER